MSFKFNPFSGQLDLAGGGVPDKLESPDASITVNDDDSTNSNGLTTFDDIQIKVGGFGMMGFYPSNWRISNSIRFVRALFGHDTATSNVSNNSSRIRKVNMSSTGQTVDMITINYSGFMCDIVKTGGEPFTVTCTGGSILGYPNGVQLHADGDSVQLHQISQTEYMVTGVNQQGIVESGSNANGSYTKFADGTMIAMHKFNIASIESAFGALFRSTAETVWTYPVPFVGETPQVSANDQNSSQIWIASNSLLTSSGHYGIFISSLAGTRTVNAVAVGKWK